MCSPQLRPTMTRSPFSRAMSKSQRGGPVWTRTTLKPFAAMRAKSRATISGFRRSSPSSPTKNVP